MRIGIIGIGKVGQALQQCFVEIDQSVVIHDTKLNTKINDVLNTSIIYICVPTPEHSDHSCDTSIVDNVIYELDLLNYQGVVAIKSTVEPGHTESLINQTRLKVCFVPEFLRERCAARDFANSNLLAVGTDSKEIFDIVCQSHGTLARNPVMMSPVEAELLKYYSNVFNATRVTFANIMYELCQHYSADYEKILETYLIRGTASPDYLHCKEDLRGFTGKCLPKDTHAVNTLLKKIGKRYKLFDAVISDNQHFTPTKIK